MTDLEITKLCAEAMGLWPDAAYSTFEKWHLDCYDPLHEDAQCMALVKKFHISQEFESNIKLWGVSIPSTHGVDENLNRAICKCVAKMMQAK